MLIKNELINISNLGQSLESNHITDYVQLKKYLIEYVFKYF